MRSAGAPPDAPRRDTRRSRSLNHQETGGSASVFAESEGFRRKGTLAQPTGLTLRVRTRTLETFQTLLFYSEDEPPPRCPPLCMARSRARESAAGCSRLRRGLYEVTVDREPRNDDLEQWEREQRLERVPVAARIRDRSEYLHRPGRRRGRRPVHRLKCAPTACRTSPTRTPRGRSRSLSRRR